MKSSGLVEEQEARAVETSESRGMNSEARIPHKARERARYSKRTINKEKNEKDVQEYYKPDWKLALDGAQGGLTLNPKEIM